MSAGRRYTDDASLNLAGNGEEGRVRGVDAFAGDGVELPQVVDARQYLAVQIPVMERPCLMGTAVPVGAHLPVHVDDDDLRAAGIDPFDVAFQRSSRSITSSHRAASLIRVVCL